MVPPFCRAWTISTLAILATMAFYNHIPHLNVLATREHVKRTVSAVADGQFALGEKPYWWKGLQRWPTARDSG